MGYGLRVDNIDGIGVIDSDYMNFEVRAHGTRPASTGHTVSYPQISSPETLVFVRPISTSSFVFTWSTWTEMSSGFTLVSTNGSPNNPTSSRFQYVSTALDYVVAQPAGRTPAPAGDYGLQVWDAAGNRVFNSNREYLRIVRIVRVAPSPTSLPVPDVDIHLPAPASGKKYYVLLSPLWATNGDVQSGVEWWWGFGACFLSSTHLRIRRFMTHGSYSGSGRWSAWKIHSNHRASIMIAEF